MVADCGAVGALEVSAQCVRVDVARARDVGGCYENTEGDLYVAQECHDALVK